MTTPSHSFHLQLFFFKVIVLTLNQTVFQSYEAVFHVSFSREKFMDQDHKIKTLRVYLLTLLNVKIEPQELFWCDGASTFQRAACLLILKYSVLIA